jgi:SAM-dependent methyltransferase
MAALHTTTDLLRLFGDPTRVRLLALLAKEELTVAELTAAMQLGQSRISNHLGRLREAELVRDRPAGKRSYYALNAGGMPPQAAQLWQVTLESTQDAVLEQDAIRARELVAARSRGMTWADAVAGQMERHYSPGRTWEATLRGVLGLCKPAQALDIASGDGAIAELLARRSEQVVCLDISQRVLDAARRRLAHLDNVDFVCGDMEKLPFEERSFDQVLLLNCLTYAKEPERAIREAARVLRTGGSLIAVTLAPHQHQRIVERYNHRQNGFEPSELKRLFEAAGLTTELCEVTSREQRPPHFEILTVHATRPGQPLSSARPT